MTSDCSAQRRQLSEAQSLTAQLQQQIRALELEKEDLLDTYRAVLIERKKLEKDLSALRSAYKPLIVSSLISEPISVIHSSEGKHRVGQASQQLQQELSATRGTVSAYEASEAKWRAEKATLHQQVFSLFANIDCGCLLSDNYWYNDDCTDSYLNSYVLLPHDCFDNV